MMFNTYVLSEQGRADMRAIQSVFSHAVNVIVARSGDGRDLAIAKTKLEEAFFFAMRAMACKPENHEEVL